MIKCIISDLGNVLISFDNDIFFRRIARISPFPEKEIKSLVHDRMNLLTLFDLGRLSPRDFHRQWVEILQSDVDYDEFFRMYNDVFSLKPLETGLLTGLKSRFRMVMLSNTDCMRYAFIRDNFPQTQFFDSYVLSYQEGCLKPDPLIYQRALKAAGFAAADCVFIDDRKENITTARHLGLETIHFPPGADLKAGLMRLGLMFAENHA